MTVLQLVDRERARLRALEVTRGTLLGVTAAGLVLALGVAALGRARWIDLPRGTPLVVWSLAVAGIALAAWLTTRRIASTASRSAVARAIEEERALRAGALRGALEV